MFPIVHYLVEDIDLDFLGIPTSAPGADNNFPFTLTPIVVHQGAAQFICEFFFRFAVLGCFYDVLSDTAMAQYIVGFYFLGIYVVV